MLDIHVKWLLVLIANFLGLMFILNIILFKPLLKIFSERESSVKGSLAAAKEMNERKEEGISRMNKEIVEARGKAKETFDRMREEGLTVQKKFLSEAEEISAGMLAKAREELRNEVVKAKSAMKADVDKFSDEIVRKLVSA